MASLERGKNVLYYKIIKMPGAKKLVGGLYLKL